MKYTKRLINDCEIYYKKYESSHRIDSISFLSEILKLEYNIYNYEIIKNNNGKPYLKENTLYYNISHKKNFIVIAISKKEIGIDVEEYISNKNYDLTILNYYYTSSERKIIKNNAKLMIEYWTKKESYIKLVGGRLSDIKSLDISTKKINQNTIYVDNYIITLSTFK